VAAEPSIGHFEMKSKNPEERLIDLEFDGVVSETGTVEAPPEVASALVSLRGTKVRVRVRSRERAAALEARGVTDEEISRIADLQAEVPEAVIRFLLSEGVLRRSTRCV
jgi:hypothetical protein